MQASSTPPRAEPRSPDSVSASCHSPECTCSIAPRTASSQRLQPVTYISHFQHPRPLPSRAHSTGTPNHTLTENRRSPPVCELSCSGDSRAGSRMFRLLLVIAHQAKELAPSRTTTRCPFRCGALYLLPPARSTHEPRTSSAGRPSLAHIPSCYSRTPCPRLVEAPPQQPKFTHLQARLLPTSVGNIDK